MLTFFALVPPLLTMASQCIDRDGRSGNCAPGREFCGEPYGADAPQYHLMDQHGCGENDPNGPSFDPVHGVFHHFYQIHLAAPPGHGPDYGHFVSKDFVHWAPLPVAIWNGYDKGHAPGTAGYVTKYDNEAIFTGSGVVVEGAGPDGKSPGLVQIYPGLCNKEDWPACGTGTLLAQAVPADYLGDELLVNWTKPSYNPIVENTQRDPSTPWQTPSGEWRLRTYDSSVYGAASSEDLLEGKWYKIGVSKDLRTCECPSLYPLPESTPGFENAYAEARETRVSKSGGGLPTHVHKTSCGGDWWQLGTYANGPPKELGTFKVTPGWEDVFDQRRIDQGNFYASKDYLYPSRTGDPRRINWGWAQVQPGSAQTLPREITFNAVARSLQQYPIKELEELRGDVVFSEENITVSTGQSVPMGLVNGIVKQSEVLVNFRLPADASATFGIFVGNNIVPPPPPPVAGRFMKSTDLPGSDYNVTHYGANTDPKICESACIADSKCKAWTYVIRGLPLGSGDCCLKHSVPCPVTSGGASAKCTSGAKTETELPQCSNSAGMACTLEWAPSSNKSSPFVDVPVSCGAFSDTLRILSSETSVEIRIYSDVTFFEIFFQRGRTAMTVSSAIGEGDDIFLTSKTDGELVVEKATAWVIGSPWVSPEDVRKAPRIYK